ncbi:MAG: homocysteine S-methyltransferase family protein [Thermomicrobiales bacterium]
MPSRSIIDRLTAGEILLMDGATGDELGKRGADVSKGREIGDPSPQGDQEYLSATDPARMREIHEEFLRRLGPWSAPVNIDAPEIVRAVHEEYLRLGADIIISNSFWTSAPALDRLGLANQWERYTRAAGELAIAARDAINPEAYVAGGIAPPPSGDLRHEFEQQTRVLADIGVDLMLAEHVGAIDEAVTAVEACATGGLPVFLGLREISATGTMQYRESFEDLVRALEGLPVAAILLMCSNPAHVSVGLPKLREVFAGPIGAYTHNPSGQDAGTDECARFARYGREWIEMGAQIVGGCCGTGSAHIEALAPVVKGHRQQAGNG